MASAASDGGVLGEFQVLVHGLWTAARGSPQAITALPTSAPQLQRDMGVFVILTGLLFAWNWGLRRGLIEPFLEQRRFNRKMKEKFAQAFMEMAFYGSFSVIGYLVVSRQEWIWPSSRWWIGFADGGHEVMRADLRLYYIAYAARYTQGGISGFIEHKRKDFLEMQIHHWVTVVLIYISYFYGWNRIGCVVMLLLDPADTCLHIAKQFKYCSDSMAKGTPRKGFYQKCADVWFAVFTLVWFATRLVMYPYVCWSAHIEATRYFPKGIPEWTCVALLETLLVLQLYWSWLIVVALKNVAVANGIEDVRSDSDVSDTEGTKDTKKSD